jgi:uncharacterized cupredoxin-like copper-binding protein
MNIRSKVLIPALAIPLLGTVLISAGCSDSDSMSAVNVTLREFSVTVDRATVPEGSVTFHVTNSGTVPHEFLVIKTDRAPDALPTESNGSYQENGTGTTLLDELEDIAPGQSKDLALDMDAAKYVLICNMVHVEPSGTQDAHYARGMRTAFKVD